MAARARRLLALLLLVPGVLAAEPPADARALLASYHEDPVRLERARELLEAAALSQPDADTLALLARAWFLMGDVRARGRDARLAAYDRGREAARRAIALAQHHEEAHVWYAVNSGRWAELRGVMSSVKVLNTVREATDTILKLNPDSVDGHLLAGGLAFELPRLLGGDRARAEEHFKHALRVDPRRTTGRIELARLYLATGRPLEARRELQQVLDEPAPTEPGYWALKDVPRARLLLAPLLDRAEPESP